MWVLVERVCYGGDQVLIFLIYIWRGRNFTGLFRYAVLDR